LLAHEEKSVLPSGDDQWEAAREESETSDENKIIRIARPPSSTPEIAGKRTPGVNTRRSAQFPDENCKMHASVDGDPAWQKVRDDRGVTAGAVKTVWEPRHLQFLQLRKGLKKGTQNEKICKGARDADNAVHPERLRDAPVGSPGIPYGGSKTRTQLVQFPGRC